MATSNIDTTMTDYNANLATVRKQYLKDYEELFGRGVMDGFETDLLPYQKFAREWEGYLKTMYPNTPSTVAVTRPSHVLALYGLASQVYIQTQKIERQI